MKIYELPSEIQARIFQLQTEAGNKPSAFCSLQDKPEDGGFPWHLSSEGFHFWNSIYKGYYKVFYETYANPEPFNWNGDKYDFVSCIIAHIMKTLPITLSEHSYDDMVDHLEKELKGWSLNDLHRNRVEIEDAYKCKIRKRYNNICELIHTNWPGEIYREEDGQKIGISVMLNKFICEIGDMMKDAFIDSYLSTSGMRPEHSREWLENVLEEALLKVNSGSYFNASNS